MITSGGPSEMWYHQKLKELGLSEEYFLSLPLECQKALIYGCFNRDKKSGKLDDFRKKIALKQYNFEEKVKELLFKKNK